MGGRPLRFLFCHLVPRQECAPGFPQLEEGVNEHNRCQNNPTACRHRSVPVTTQTRLARAPPPGQGRAGLQAKAKHRPARLVPTCLCPTRSRPGSHQPATSGTCPAGSPEAPRSWTRSENPRWVWGPSGMRSSFPHIHWHMAFLSLLSHSAPPPRGVRSAQDAASPVCVTSHIGERAGEVDEPAEAADEVNAHEGVLHSTASREHRPGHRGPGRWAEGTA